MNEELEKAIDDVGRDRVFMRAESHGWPRGGGAPEWVWWAIVRELQANQPPPAPKAGTMPLDFLWRMEAAVQHFV